VSQKNCALEGEEGVTYLVQEVEVGVGVTYPAKEGVVGEAGVEAFR